MPRVTEGLRIITLSQVNPLVAYRIAARTETQLVHELSHVLRWRSH